MGRAADRLGRVGQRLRTLPDEAVQSGNRRIRSRVVAAMKEGDVFGADLRLSGLRNGVPQRVKTTKRSTGNGQVVVGRVMGGPPRQRAPLFWKEEGVRAGRRGPPVGRYNSRRTYRGVHPAQPPTRFWSRAVGKALPEVRADIERRYRAAVGR